MRSKFNITIFIFIITLSLTISAFPLFGTAYAGCGGLKCITSNGIKLNGSIIHSSSDIDTVYIQTIDSVNLSIYGVGGCGLSLLKISLNGQELNAEFNNNGLSFVTTKLLGIPGYYTISALNGSTPVFNYFVFLPPPLGLHKNSDVSHISIFPNPAEHDVTLLNENEIFKSIRVYNASGLLFDKQNEINNQKITIHVDNYPPGIYFIHVATLTDKIIIKKIIVL